MYNKTTNKLTTASKLEKRDNDYAINTILSAFSESVALIFENLVSSKDMWNALINKFKGNAQIKSTKLTGLEIKFENFKLENGESMEEMYYRLLQIQNYFMELGESLSNNKIVRKILHVMFREPRWEEFVSALEVLSRTQTFTPDELFVQLQNFE